MDVRIATLRSDNQTPRIEYVRLLYDLRPYQLCRFAIAYYYPFIAGRLTNRAIPLFDPAAMQAWHGYVEECGRKWQYSYRKRGNRYHTAKWMAIRYNQLVEDGRLLPRRRVALPRLPRPPPGLRGLAFRFGAVL